MTNNTETLNDDEAGLVGERQRKLKARLLLITGCLGVVMQHEGEVASQSQSGLR